MSMLLVLAACGGSSSSSPAPASSAPASSAPASEAPASEAPASEEPAAWSFDHRIEIMMPAPEGSGVDTTMRKFLEYVEKELGTNISLTNMAGASGVTGFTWARDQVSDGYFFQYSSPSAVGAAVMGNFDFDFFDEIVPLTKLVSTHNVIYASAKAPFNDYDSLIEYAKANPGKVTVAVQSTTGIAGASMGKFLSACGMDLRMINFEGEAAAAAISGEVNLIMDTFGEGSAYIESGDLIPIVYLSDERSESFPNVPCAADFGLDAAIENWYGFFCFQDTPEEAREAFLDAVLKAAANPEWTEFCENLGFANAACPQEEFTETFENTKDAMKTAFDFFASATIN
jgi:tripartite-type tricarboxylate transporter receptor subunit TctC